MKIRILGCGAAGGVPMVSRGWGACDPLNTKNRRLRASLMIMDQDRNILIDTGPDLREQLLSCDVNSLDAVLYTHEHADHTHGIDELREINRVMRSGLPIYANQVTLRHLKDRFSYAFKPVNAETETFYHPWLEPNLITSGQPFYVHSLKVTPFAQDHEYTTSIGFRIGNFGYSTDAVRLFESSISLLKGIDIWVVGCLSDKDHPSHASINQVLEWVKIIKPKRTILTHMSIDMDYDTLKRTLPKNIEPAYDGLEVEITP